MIKSQQSQSELRRARGEKRALEVTMLMIVLLLLVLLPLLPLLLLLLMQLEHLLLSLTVPLLHSGITATWASTPRPIALRRVFAYGSVFEDQGAGTAGSMLCIP